MDNDKEMDALRDDIEVTRQRISGELEAIGERLTPEHAKAVAKEKIVEAKDRAIQNVKTSARSAARVAGRTGGEIGPAIRENPIPAILVGVGVGWLIYKAVGRARAAEQLELPLPRTTYAGTYEGVGSTYEGMGTEPSYEFDVEVPEGPGRVQRTKERISHAASGARHRASDAGRVVRDRATDLAQRSKHGAEVAWRKSNDSYAANPLLFGGIAIAAGFGLGMMFPSTTRERELLGERRERVVSRAKDYARQASEVAMESAKEGMRAAKETAKEEVETRRTLP